MAFPASFEESNAVLGPPQGMDEDEVSSLCILRAEQDGAPVVISCWKLTKEELEEINRTGRVWLGIYGVTMPPAWVAGIKPLEGT